MKCKIWITNEGVDTFVTQKILESEGISYEIVVDKMKAMSISRGRVNPANGWVVEFDKPIGLISVSWKGIYLGLSEIGMLRAI